MSKGNESRVAEGYIVTHCKDGKDKEPGHDPLKIGGQKRGDDDENPPYGNIGSKADQRTTHWLSNRLGSRCLHPLILSPQKTTRPHE